MLFKNLKFFAILILEVIELLVIKMAAMLS